MCDACGDNPKFKSAPNTEERMAELQQQAVANILEYGCQVNCVFPDEGGEGTTFHYTEGRALFEAPDLLIVGMPPQVGHAILNEAVRLQSAGEIALADGVEIPPDVLLAKYPCRVIRCDPEASEMYGAMNFSDKEIEAYQLVWPDPEGRFPGEPGCTLTQQVLYPLET